MRIYEDQSQPGRHIEIRLLRNPDVEDAYTDDKISIVPDPDDENSYEVVFRDADSRVKYNVTLDGDSLDTYLSGLYLMLPFDKDPYRGIQFSIPGFPSILFSLADLKRKTVRNSLKNLLPLLTTTDVERY